LAGIDVPGGEVVGQGLHLGAVRQTELSDPIFLNSVVHTLAAAYLAQDEDLRFPYYDVES
jgi:hypothetical protein